MTRPPYRPTTPRGSAHVVRVQLPLGGQIEPGRGLVYDEGRVHLNDQPLPAVVHELLLTKPRRKAYFEAVWTGDAWEIGALTTDQPW